MISTALAFAMYGSIIVGLVLHRRYQVRKHRATSPPPPLPLRRPRKQALPVGHPDLKYHLPLAEWQAWKALEHHLEEASTSER